MLSPAKEHGDKAHQKGNVPAAQAPDTNVIVTPSNPADDNPAAGVDNSVNEQPQQDTSTPTTTVPADDSTSSNDAADDSSSASSDAADASSASQSYEDAPGFTAASENGDDHGDDHGDDRGDDHGDDHGHDKGDDHGKDNKAKKPKKAKKDKDDKGKGHDKNDNPGKGHDKDDKPGKGHDKDNPGKGHDKDKPGKGHDKDNPGKGHDKDNSGPQSVPAPAAALGPALSNAVVQVTSSRTCTSRRALTIRLDRGYRVRAARVLLNGHLVRVARHNKRVTAQINLRGRAKGSYTVRTVVVTKGNRIRIGTRRYMTCSPKRLTAKPRY